MKETSQQMSCDRKQECPTGEDQQAHRSRAVPGRFRHRHRAGRVQINLPAFFFEHYLHIGIFDIHKQARLGFHKAHHLAHSIDNHLLIFIDW